MNLYFLKDVNGGEVKYVGTGLNLDDFVKTLNHYLYNLHMVNDYYQKAELSDQNKGRFYVVIIEGYHDDPDWEVQSGKYLVMERQVAPDRIYDLIP